MHARIDCAPALAVKSARLPFAESMLWMAARDADAARNDTFFPTKNRIDKKGETSGGGGGGGVYSRSSSRNDI